MLFLALHQQIPGATVHKSLKPVSNPLYLNTISSTTPPVPLLQPHQYAPSSTPSLIHTTLATTKTQIPTSNHQTFHLPLPSSTTMHLRGNYTIGIIIASAFIGSIVSFVILWFTWGRVLRGRRNRRLARMKARKAESIEMEEGGSSKVQQGVWLVS